MSNELEEVRERLKLKIERNEWDNIQAVIDTLEKMRDGKWNWALNSRCKYLNLRVDMRDGGCLIKDRNGARIAPEELFYQYSPTESGDGDK